MERHARGYVEAVPPVGQGCEGRRMCQDSPAVVRVTQCSRSPSRRMAPQKRPRQDLAAVRCVRVRTEEVRCQLEVVKEERKRTAEEGRMSVKYNYSPEDLDLLRVVKWLEGRKPS